jgi:hypothetical protein
VYLSSKNGISNTLEDHQKNIDLHNSSTKVVAQQEDLQFLAQILREQLLAEVPSGEFFQVKCAFQDQLMILAQHPQAVRCHPETIFTVLEEALQSLSAYNEQRVELFLRIIGQKFPYAKRSLTLREEEISGVGDEEDITISSNSSSISVLVSSPPMDEPQDEFFDPTSASYASTHITSKPKYPVPIQALFLVSAALMVIAVFGGGAYILTRSCLTLGCQQIQTAKQLQKSLGQQKLSFRSEKELPKIQHQLHAASLSLEMLPPWSPHRQEAKQLAANLSGQSEKIQQVVNAFQIGSMAAQKSQTPANSLQELEARQQLWRQAIAPLETINSNSELYQLVYPKLLIYRTHLQTVKQQLHTEERWLKKLTAAKAVAIVAAQREATAKSLADLQKVQLTWQITVNALAAIPPSSSVYPQAQKLLVDYKPFLAAARDRATIELLAAKTYNQAINAASLAKHYEQKNQWSDAVIHWNQALNAAKQVTSDSMTYTQAQTLITPYSTALNQAQEKQQVASLLQKIRTDLNQTCYSTIRFCNYTIDNQAITVQLTPEYEQMLQSNEQTANNQSNSNTLINVTHHLQSLQQALGIISDNANLPLVLYNIQGFAIHTHNPEG